MPMARTFIEVPPWPVVLSLADTTSVAADDRLGRCIRDYWPRQSAMLQITRNALEKENF